MDDAAQYWTDIIPDLNGFYWVADKNKNVLGVGRLETKMVNGHNVSYFDNEVLDDNAVYFFKQKQAAPIFKEISREEVVIFIRTMMRDTDNYKPKGLWKVIPMIKNVRELTGWSLRDSKNIVDETLKMNAMDIFRIRRKESKHKQSDSL